MDVGDAQKRFGGAKSISSAQYYGEDKPTNNPETERRLNKFQGSSAISSADFFERDETDEFTTENLARKLAYTATTDFGQFTNVVVDGGKKITTMASDFFSDLQTRYQ